MLKCKTQYFQGYFNVEETVLDLWPRVNDAQVLPTSMWTAVFVQEIALQKVHIVGL